MHKQDTPAEEPTVSIKLNPKSRDTFNWATKRAASDVPAAEKKLAKLRDNLALAEAKREEGYPADNFTTYRMDALLARIAELEAAIPVAEAELAEAVRLRPQWLQIVEQYAAVM